MTGENLVNWPRGCGLRPRRRGDGRRHLRRYPKGRLRIVEHQFDLIGTIFPVAGHDPSPVDAWIIDHVDLRYSGRCLPILDKKTGGLRRLYTFEGMSTVRRAH